MDETIRAWIGVVYELPPFPPGRSAAPITLHELLALGNGFPMPDLGDRFRLAQKLSEFMLHIHSCGWLHKGLRPDNVLFFSTSPVSIKEPYIVGWEYSRKVANIEQTETILSDNHDADLYCHPDQLKKQSYRPQFDHYKLGCLLLEIGQWNLLQDIPKGTEIQPGDMKAKLMRRAGRLGKSMGKIYQDVVKLLLQGLDDGNFWADVVLQLKKCNA
jgi:serine/threonine protein kinase